MTTLTTDGVAVTVPSFTTYHNLGPLAPTSFPVNCLTDWWDMQTIALGMPSVWSYHTQGCATSTCCPSGIFYTEGWAWMTSYYSPGVCPSQYKSCVPPSAPTALSSASGETIAFCCPTSECFRHLPSIAALNLARSKSSHRLRLSRCTRLFSILSDGCHRYADGNGNGQSD